MNSQERHKLKNQTTKKNFYLIYSRETVKIRKDEATMLNLQFKVNLPEGIEAGIGLLPTLVSNSLRIENFKRLSNKTKDEFIELDLLNQNYHKSVTMRKNQAFAYMILINDNEEDTIITKHMQL